METASDLLLQSQTLTFASNDGLLTQSVELQSGLTMKSVAQVVNDSVSKYGIIANAMTSVRGATVLTRHDGRYTRSRGDSIAVTVRTGVDYRHGV